MPNNIIEIDGRKLRLVDVGGENCDACVFSDKYGDCTLDKVAPAGWACIEADDDHEPPNACNYVWRPAAEGGD